MWHSSQIGWIFTRNYNDIKTRSSVAFKVISAPVDALNRITVSEKLLAKMHESLLFSLAAHFEYGVYLIIFLAPFIPTMACVALVVVTFISFFINKLMFNKTDICVDALGMTLIILIALFAFYAVTSLAMMSSIKIWMVYAPFIAFVYLVIQAITTKKRLITVGTVFVTSGLFVSMYGIYQQFFGTNLGHAWLDDEMFTEISHRVYSTLGNPNVLGEYLLLAIPIALAMLWAIKKPIGKLYFLGCTGAMTLCMIFTQSRGCWLGLLVTIAVFIILVDKRYILLGVIALFFLPFVLPDSIISRFTSIGNVSDSSTSYRVYIWLGTINMLKDFGIFGIGLGSDAYNQIYPFYSYSAIIAPHAHNIYLQLLCETGIAGLITFITALILSVKKMYLGVIADRKELCGIVSAAVIAGLFGFMLQGAFDYVWYNYRVFLIFWIVIGIGLAARRLAYDKDSSCNK